MGWELDHEDAALGGLEFGDECNAIDLALYEQTLTEVEELRARCSALRDALAHLLPLSELGCVRCNEAVKLYNAERRRSQP